MPRRPASINGDEIAVASNEELHAAPLSGKRRLLALWNALPGVDKRRKVGDREALIDRPGNRTNRSPNPELAEIDRQIAEWVDRSTQELLLAWRQLHRTGPPHGLSRDLLIRALADDLQQQTHGGTSRALRRRLQTLAGKFEKGGASFDPGIVLKTGTRLVRQWRGHTHTVLVREDVSSDGLPFAALAKREGVSPSYFTRLVRLSFLASDRSSARFPPRCR